MMTADYICHICSLVLLEPVQLICGHRYCRSCVNNQNETIIKCIQCKEETRKNEIFIDRDCKNDKQILEVMCCRCNWIGIWKNYQNHLNENHIICNYCHEIFHSIIDLNQHQRSSCQNSIVYCTLLPYGCTDQILRKDLSKHYLTKKHQCILLNVLDKLKNKIKKKLSHLSSHVYTDGNP